MRDGEGGHAYTAVGCDGANRLGTRANRCACGEYVIDQQDVSPRKLRPATHPKSSVNIVPTLVFRASGLRGRVAMAAERAAVDGHLQYARQTLGKVLRLVVSAPKSAQRVERHGYDHIDVGIGSCAENLTAKPFAHFAGEIPLSTILKLVNYTSIGAVFDIEKERRGVFEDGQSPQSSLHCVVDVADVAREWNSGTAVVAQDLLAFAQSDVADGARRRKKYVPHIAEGVA